MSFCVVERSPGLPFSGAVPRVRSMRTGQVGWPKVRSMRSSEVRLRRMRTASRSAATAAAPCEASVDPAAMRRGTRPLTRLRPVQTAANPSTGPEAARRLCRSRGASLVNAAALPPVRRQPAGKRSPISPKRRHAVRAVRPTHHEARATGCSIAVATRTGRWPAASGACVRHGRRLVSAPASTRELSGRTCGSLRFNAASQRPVQPMKLFGPSYRRSRDFDDMPGGRQLHP